MRKNSITEPKFGKIFAVRFLISLIIFALLAAYALYRVDDYVWNKVNSDVDEFQEEITDTTRDLSRETPGSERYERLLGQLKMLMALYQTYDHSYVEVTIGNETISIADTAYFAIYETDGDPDYYFIEDISYLDPVKDKVDEKKQIDIYNKVGRDPLFEVDRMKADEDRIGELDNYRSYRMSDAFINRETHTFLPGWVTVWYMGEEYVINCTPPDTKGYEKVTFSITHGTFLGIDYRATPGLSSADFVTYRVADPDFDCDEINASEITYYSGDRSGGANWYIGFAQPYYPSWPVFQLAPVTSAVIIASAVVLAFVVSLILAKIRYQKDKTVWKIFEYRIKTTEAMAHDLKTPLSTTMFYLENLEESADDPEKVREYARNINEKIVKMDQMISDILMLSRSESGKISLAKEEVSLRELLGDCLKEFPSMETEIRGDDVVLTTDRKVLGQVIMNLFSNCDRYRLEGSVVSVDIGSDVLIVCNPTDRTYDDVESLKKPFVKGEDSRGSKGAGLGLAIAENNLAILGYKLELSSESGKFKVRIKFKP